MIRLCLFITAISTSLFGNAQYATELTVAQDGSGDYIHIQEAIDATKAFPEEDITIRVKKGIYEEKVRLYAWNNRVSIIGEDRDSTIISWHDHFDLINRGRNSTFLTYTFQIEANDVLLKNLTIRNTAGPVGQAVALHLDGDRVQVINCTITGHQDTLYLTGENFRQYFHNCFISGTTDFIFGEATAVFENCELHSLSDSYITAASTLAGSAYGLVFIDCRLTAEADVQAVYLGRPWRSFAKTAFIRCEMGSHILPTGWDNWKSAEKELTVSYCEYHSTGPGGHTDHRVTWAHLLSRKEAEAFTLPSIFKDWQPSN